MSACLHRAILLTITMLALLGCSEEDAPPVRKPLWIIVGTLLCIYVVYRWIMG